MIRAEKNVVPPFVMQPTATLYTCGINDYF